MNFQHVILIKEGVKNYLQKLRTIRPTLEPIINKELRKLLDARIIFKVFHSTWVSNLVLIRKKSGEKHLCVDFHNLNRVSFKDNYPMPSVSVGFEPSISDQSSLHLHR